VCVHACVFTPETSRLILTKIGTKLIFLN